MGKNTMPVQKLRQGTVLDDFEVQERIGTGPHAEVYRARHVSSGDIVALKVEDPMKILQHEASVLESFQGSQYACMFFKFVKVDSLTVSGSQCGLLAMELLGTDFSSTRKALAFANPDGKVPLQIASKMAVQMVRAVRDFHRTTLCVHRDVVSCLFIAYFNHGLETFEFCNKKWTSQGFV